MKYTNIICINCDTRGHGYKDCVYPISSYGIITFKRVNNDIKFLLIQRRDTMGYSDFLRGRYKRDSIEILIDEMTTLEKIKIKTQSFDDLWDDLWVDHRSRTYRTDKENAKKKFISLDIQNLFSECLITSKWEHNEYSIPKGRKNNNEDTLDCAIREFREETGFTDKDIKILDSDIYQEIFIGSNGVSYKHVYYLAEILSDKQPKIDKNNLTQIGEVKDVNFFSYKETMNLFRDYDVCKRNIIYKLYNKLTKI